MNNTILLLSILIFSVQSSAQISQECKLTFNLSGEDIGKGFRFQRLSVDHQVFKSNCRKVTVDKVKLNRKNPTGSFLLPCDQLVMLSYFYSEIRGNETRTNLTYITLETKADKDYVMDFVVENEKIIAKVYTDDESKTEVPSKFSSYPPICRQ